MAATSGRRHSRYRVRPGAPGPAGEHRAKIGFTLAASVAAVVLVLTLTSEGRDLDAATQHFMLYYAGVFALIGLTASVAIGLVATDRVFLTPGHRVLAQALHRAVSFGALAFLVIHIVTEVLAQRVHVIDGFVPFLSPFRRFYIGLGTLAGDLVVLLVMTSIIRKRFTGHGQAWRWRAIHYTAYLAFISGVLHGLMAGRTAKPYVDWSYGAAIGLVMLGLAVRLLATSLRPKESLSAPPASTARTPGAQSGAAPLHAAALSLAQAGGTMRLLPAGATAYRPNEFAPLGAPPFGDGAGYLGAAAAAPGAGIASLPPPPPYEPGYLGPPRYEGARRTGPIPSAATGPMPRVATGPMPAATTGPMPAANTGPVPRVATGPMPRLNTGPVPRVATGPTPRLSTGPMPAATTGPMPAANSGPMPRLSTGPMPAANSGPMPAANTGPMPAANTGPMPRMDTSMRPRAGAHSRRDTGPMPRLGPSPDGTGATGPGSSDRHPPDRYLPGDRARGRRHWDGQDRPSQGYGASGGGARWR